MNFTYIINDSLSYIPPKDTITLSNCLDYCEAIRQNNKIMLIVIGLLVIYVIILLRKQR